MKAYALVALLLATALFVSACTTPAPSEPAQIPTQTIDEQPEPQAMPIIDAPIDTAEREVIDEAAPVRIVEAEDEVRDAPRRESSSDTAALENYLDFVASDALILFDTNARGPLVSAATNIIAYKQFPSGLDADAVDTSETSLDNYDGRDLVLLGDACNNAFAAAFVATNTEGCVEAFDDGEARVWTLREDGRSVLIVLGSDETMVHRFVEAMAREEVAYLGSERSWRE